MISGMLKYEEKERFSIKEAIIQYLGIYEYKENLANIHSEKDFYDQFNLKNARKINEPV